MERYNFGNFSSELERFGAAGVGMQKLELERRGKYLLQYIPFEHVNVEAKLVIVGITPGPNQLELAYDVAQKLLKAGWPESETLMEVKKVGASNALYVGLGPCPQAALQWCIDNGYLRQEQLVGAFCHPSTTGGSTTRYYLREVTREDLTPRNPVLNRCDWLDHAYQQMKAATASLLGEEYMSPETTKTITAPRVVEHSIVSGNFAKPKMEDRAARVPPTKPTNDIAAIRRSKKYGTQQS